MQKWRKRAYQNGIQNGAGVQQSSTFGTSRDPCDLEAPWPLRARFSRVGPGHRSRGPCTNGARDPGGGERREKEHGSWVMDHDLQILTAWDMPAHREDSLRESTARPRGSTSQLMYWRGKEIFGPHFEARPVSVRPRLKDEPKNCLL